MIGAHQRYTGRTDRRTVNILAHC